MLGGAIPGRGGGRWPETPAFQGWSDTWLCLGCCYPSSAPHIIYPQMVVCRCGERASGWRVEVHEMRSERWRRRSSTRSWRDTTGRITRSRPSGPEADVATVFVNLGAIALASLLQPSRKYRLCRGRGYWGWLREGDFGEAGQQWKAQRAPSLTAKTAPEVHLSPPPPPLCLAGMGGPGGLTGRLVVGTRVTLGDTHWALTGTQGHRRGKRAFVGGLLNRNLCRETF